MSGLNNFNTNQGPTPPPMAPPAVMSMPPSNDTSMECPDFLINLNEKHRDDAPALFRDSEITQMISILIGALKPNVMLVGDAGTGKTRIVEDLARRLEDPHDVTVPRQLSNAIIYEMPVSALMSGTALVGSLEKKIEGLIGYVSEHPEAIIFIDEIHQLFNDKYNQKAAEALKPAMARGDMRIIGATTTTEINSVMDNPAFARRMTRLNVNELTMEQSEIIMAKTLPTLNRHYGHRLNMTEETLHDIAVIAERNRLAHQHRPDIGLTLLDRTMADTLTHHQQHLAEATQAGDDQLAETLASINPITVTSRQATRSMRRMTTGSAQAPTLDITALRAALSTLRGQDEPLIEITNSLRRHRLNISPSKRPLSWLLAGPSGVGKTETARIIAQQYSNHDPIILNMTEYSSPSSTTKLTGSDPGFVGFESNRDTPLTPIMTDPYRIVILDEIEKAHIEVQRLFFQVLDQGILKDSRQQIIDMSKCIIIATTNAGGDELSKPTVGFGVNAPSATKALDILNKTGMFDHALLSRFSMITGYNPIDRETYIDILDDTYHRLFDALDPEQQTMLPDDLPDTARALLAQRYTREQGARTALRAVEGWMADTLIDVEDQNI